MTSESKTNPIAKARSKLEGPSAPTGHCIEARTLEDLEEQMQAIAEDPDVQREVAAINREFTVADNDGLNKKND